MRIGNVDKACFVMFCCEEEEGTIYMTLREIEGWLVLGVKGEKDI